MGFSARQKSRENSSNWERLAGGVTRRSGSDGGGGGGKGDVVVNSQRITAGSGGVFLKLRSFCSSLGVPSAGFRVAH